MKTHGLTDPAGIEDLLLFRMSKVIAQGGGLVRRICEGRFGITRREWTVLAIVATQSRVAWSEVRVRCEVDEAQFSRAVSSLVAKGLLHRENLPNRQVLLQLSEPGRALYEEMFPIALGIHGELLAALDPATIAILESALARLHERGEELAARTPVPKADRSRGRGR